METFTRCELNGDGGRSRAFGKIRLELAEAFFSIAEPSAVSVSLDHTEGKAAISAIVGGSTSEL